MRNKMVTLEFGAPQAPIVLIQMVGDQDLASLEKEFLSIKENANADFRLLACKVDHWNADLSPWGCPAVYGKEDFAGGAAATLSEVMKYCTDKSKSYYIGGYSLAGLFALWAAYQADLFQGVAAASPSVWFPGFLEYMKGHVLWGDTVYLSLGDKEERTRNPLIATVGERIREAFGCLTAQGKRCILEWNPGNHFKDADLRTAKAFCWVLSRSHR